MIGHHRALVAPMLGRCVGGQEGACGGQPLSLGLGGAAASIAQRYSSYYWWAAIGAVAQAVTVQERVVAVAREVVVEEMREMTCGPHMLGAELVARRLFIMDNYNLDLVWLD